MRPVFFPRLDGHMEWINSEGDERSATFDDEVEPAEEIMRAAEVSGARVVVLSLVFSADEVRSREDLRMIRRFLDPAVPVVVGGGSAERLAEGSQDAGIVFRRDMKGLRGILAELAAAGSPPASGAVAGAGAR